MASKSGGMLSGLSNKSPSASDKSTKLPSGSVNSDTTRSSTAEAQPTLGPRTA